MQDIPDIETNPVFRAARKVAVKLNCRVFLIGGCVRDMIMGKHSSDMDFIVNTDVINFTKLVIQKLKPVPKVTVFKKFLTVHFEYDGNRYEFTHARKESYTENSRNPIVEPATFEDDLMRRDFTINTIAISLNSENYGEITDIFDGIGDIRRKIIRTPLSSHITFNDDPLRMLRAIRFSAQLNFKIDKECLSSIKDLHKRIQIVAPERIAEELNKILMTEKPARAFRMMKHLGLLSEILPEVSSLSGTKKIDNYSHKDIFIHTLEVLDKLSESSASLWLRWSALLHDTGKLETKRFNQKHGWTFYGHEVVSSSIAEKIFHRLKLPKNEKFNFVKKIILLHMRPISLIEDEVTDSAVRRLLFETGDDIEALMQLCRADITSKNEEKIKQYLQNFDNVSKKLVEVEIKDKLRNWQPPISGETIIEIFGIKPSKEVGIIKTAVREAILDGIIPNNYDDACKFMITFAKSLNLKPVKR